MKTAPVRRALSHVFAWGIAILALPLRALIPEITPEEAVHAVLRALRDLLWIAALVVWASLAVKALR